MQVMNEYRIGAEVQEFHNYLHHIKEELDKQNADHNVVDLISMIHYEYEDRFMSVIVR